MGEQEIPASAEKESVSQDTPLPTSSSSNSLPLIPITTIDDNTTYQDSPSPTPDQMEQVFRHLELHPVPFFHPSASNHVPRPVAAAAGSLVSSTGGETDSSSSSGASYGGLTQQELPSLLHNKTFMNPNFKLNVAVTQCIDEGIQFLGLAAVVRDSDSFVRQAMTLTWDPNLNPNLDFAEYYIFNRGIALCALSRYRRLVAETQALWLVTRYQRGFYPGLFDSFQVRHVSENDNHLARAFAAMALQIENVYWTPQQIMQFFGSLRLPH
ncbi:hypothetical protein L6164_028826 [Bauhinia variegata]|uniref:Uncharacterized protein n=1 Tax=Bauhinia variegata TaxID=167791 RepID=A0ACB9L7R4_BAUVA|nr:hypothetical protein L6164_028826 [Bauhinia variegata]